MNEFFWIAIVTSAVAFGVMGVWCHERQRRLIKRIDTLIRVNRGLRTQLALAWEKEARRGDTL